METAFWRKPAAGVGVTIGQRLPTKGSRRGRDQYGAVWYASQAWTKIFMLTTLAVRIAALCNDVRLLLCTNSHFRLASRASICAAAHSGREEPSQYGGKKWHVEEHRHLAPQGEKKKKSKTTVLKKNMGKEREGGRLLHMQIVPPHHYSNEEATSNDCDLIYRAWKCAFENRAFCLVRGNSRRT